MTIKIAASLFKYFPYGGLQHDCLKIIKECLHRHHQIDLYTMKWEGEPPPSGCRITTVPVKGWSNHRRCLAFSQYMVSHLKQSNYDVVIGFNRIAGLDCYYAGDVCFVADSRAKHSIWFRLTPRYRTYAKLERAVFSPDNACDILALTQQQIDTYRHYYATPHERFHLLAPMLNKQFAKGENYAALRQQYRRQMACGQGSVMLMVGSDFQRKGLDRALRALAALPPALKAQSYLWVIGDDKIAPWQALAAQLGVTEQVKFLGAQQDVLPFYAAADLLIHPAYQEAAGMVLLEALVCGLPVVATDVCGYACHIIKSRAGIVLMSPFQQQQLNEKIAALLDNRGLRQGYVTNAAVYCQQVDFYHGQVEVVNQLEAIAKRQANMK